MLICCSVLPVVLHTGKRWFIICPVAEHPASEAPESSPQLPLSSLQPEASQGRSSQNLQPPHWYLGMPPPGITLLVPILALSVLMFCWLSLHCCLTAQSSLQTGSQ